MEADLDPPWLTQVSSIEFSLVEKDILFGLQQGNLVLNQINASMNIDMVEQLLSDTADGIAYQRVRSTFFP